jgi:amino acid permease
MTSTDAFRRFSFAYGISFALLYVVVLELDLALFTVYPSLGVVLAGTHHARDIVDPAMAFLAPAMYWYGWTATAALGALVVGLTAAWLPERWTRWFWPGWSWVVPGLAMCACVYLTLPWFRLQLAAQVRSELREGDVISSALAERRDAECRA